jgi:histone H4
MFEKKGYSFFFSLWFCCCLLVLKINLIPQFDEMQLKSEISHNDTTINNEHAATEQYRGSRKRRQGLANNSSGRTSNGGKPLPGMRHRRILRDTIHGITKPDIRRLARRGGVKRIANGCYEAARGALKVFLEGVLHDALTYAEHAKRTTVMTMDVICSLKRQGHTLYGFRGAR